MAILKNGLARIKTYPGNGSDYFTGGSQIQERSWNADSYRFGFGGMLKDDEIKGSGNSLDFGARIYDSRLMRWLSRDKFAANHPDFSPYAYAALNPILIIDVGGNDWYLNPWSSPDQQKAFKSNIENRFNNQVTINYETVEYTYYETQLVDGEEVLVPHTVEQIQVTMTFNEEEIKAQVKKDNPDASPDEIQTLVQERKNELAKDPSYAYLNKQFNSDEEADVWGITLAGTWPIADYQSGTINAKALANSPGSIGFALLIHEIAEQAALAQGLQYPDMVESDGYPSAHWFALHIQAQEMNTSMAITLEDGGAMTLTVYKEVVKDGELVGYEAVEYSVYSDHYRVTFKREDNTRELTIEEYEQELNVEKKKINDERGD